MERAAWRPHTCWNPLQRSSGVRRHPRIEVRVAIDDPMFAQFPRHDAAISEWFARQGWPVMMRHFDCDRDVFAWRHETATRTRTVRVTQSTLEDYSPDQIIAVFEASRLAEVLPKAFGRYVILRRKGPGSIGFDILDAPPLK